MKYMICAQDPGGGFVEVEWWTDVLPRVGDDVMLPQDEEAITSPLGNAGNWQELSVIDVSHRPYSTEVWLGGAAGWDAGSVKTLFDNARRFREKQS